MKKGFAEKFLPGSGDAFENERHQLRHGSPASDAIIGDGHFRSAAPPARSDSGKNPARRPPLCPDVQNGLLQPNRKNRIPSFHRTSLQARIRQQFQGCWKYYALNFESLTTSPRIRIWDN